MNYPKITNIFLVLTHRCNLACRYCFVQQEKLDMTLKTALDAIDYVAKNARETKTASSITFFGGEPLLRWADIIVPAVEYTERVYRDVKINFSITTNCVLLTEDKIKFIKEHNIGILTSIDGCEDTQNYNRPFHNGTGSFEIVEKNLRLYKEIVGLQKSTFRSTVYPPTCKFMFKNYEYAIDFGYPSMFFITDSFSEWTSESRAIVEEQLNKICDHYIAYWKEHKKAPIRLNAIQAHMNQISVDVAREETGQEILQKQPFGKCGYGQGAAGAVSPVGDIYGCQEMTSNEGPQSIFYIGNIYDGVSDERREALKTIYESTKPQGDIACENCTAKSICNGGCIANNYLSTQDMNHATYGYCFFNRLLYDQGKRIYKELRDIPEFLATVKPIASTSKSCGECQRCQSWLYTPKPNN